MVDFKNSDDLREWLTGKPKEFSVVIAARAALRVLPELGRLFFQNRFKPAYSRSIILPVFRVMFLPLIAARYSENGRKLAVNTKFAANAAFAANTAVFSAGSVNAAINATNVVTFTYLANAVEHTFGGKDFTFSSVSLTYHEAVKAAITAGPATYEADVGLLEEEGLLPEKLAFQPLWSDDIPDGTKTTWDSLQQNLLTLDENWQVWTDWYEDVLAGRNRAGLPDDLAEELDLKIALQENDWWESGPAKVNGDIKTWTAAAFEKNENRLRIARQREYVIDHMKEWFFSNFEDPQVQTPYDSESGTYIYLEGGPYNACYQLEEYFLEQYSEEYIDIAVESIESGGTADWAPVHENGLIYNPDFGDIPWSVAEPEPTLGPQYDIVDGKLTSIEHLPTQDELSSQESLHNNLRNQITTLASAVGFLENQYPALVDAIKEYADILRNDIDELDVDLSRFSSASSSHLSCLSFESQGAFPT